MQEQAINFGYQLSIPEIILNKIKVEFNDLNESLLNIKALPSSLTSGLLLEVYSKQLKDVKFFQFSDPMFILSMLRAMRPKLSMINDMVVVTGEIAEEMYFISKGLVSVIATDNITIIATLNEGSYFGEIGILMTNIRTVSIKA